MHKIEYNNSILGHLEIRKLIWKLPVSAENFHILESGLSTENVPQKTDHDYMRSSTKQETEALMSKIMWRLLYLPLCYWVDTHKTIVMIQQWTSKDCNPAIVVESIIRNSPDRERCFSFCYLKPITKITWRVKLWIKNCSSCIGLKLIIAKLFL